ncbi:MAG: 1-acyl-sn-glycerol-3-phosphate acyltransferase [Deltaproteobacteria bacterium]|nr:1-acyl-sn-glycerol-3-phosphate acyltransferase [Deltaproteobacteria bacterium]
MMQDKKPFYPFVLDHKPRLFLDRQLYRLFKRVQFNKNMTEPLKQMHRNGTVVYAIKYRGQLDYLLYHYRFRKSRLPYPKIAFDLNMSLVLPLSQLFRIFKFHISFFFRHGSLPNPYRSGFLESAILGGTSSLLCLVDPKGFARHFIHAEKDPLQFLIDIQKKTDRPIYLVPQLVLYKKTPEKDQPGLFDIFFGFKDKPGALRKIMLFFRHNRQAFIDFGTPLDLKSYLKGRDPADPLEDIAAEVRQELLESIDRQKRVILGPVIKSRQQFKERVLKDPDVIQSIESKSSRNSARLKHVRKEAAAYFDEIAADYNIAYIQFANIVLTWIWKRMFQGIDVNPDEMAFVRECGRKGPVIYVPSHKSHIDYLVLNLVLYQHHMHIPRIAAGRNLAFWPMGPFFRKSGAFFIRRSFKGARLYATVFTRYIKALLEERHPLEFFIEGGRSRSGKLVLPKIGFLSILIQAFKEGACDDLVFVPASITYDRIIEEQSYLKELGGGQKKKESFQQVIGTRRFLKKKYGKIYIRFGQPVLLKDYLALNDPKEANTHKRLAFHLIRAINRASLVTPMALLASAILTKHRRGFHLQELTDTAGILLKFLETYRVPLATSLSNYEKAVEETLALLIKGSVVDSLEDLDESEIFYYVDDDKKRELEYYKNSIVHCFISHAFVALSLLTGKEEVKTGQAILDDYQFFMKVFRYEFIYDEAVTVQKKIDEATRYFTEASCIAMSASGEGYILTKLGFDQLPLWAAFTKTFLESYWIATRSIMAKEKSGRKKSELLKNMNYLGQRFHKLGVVEHLEAVSRLSFENAIRVINEDIFSGRRKSEKDSAQANETLKRFSQRLHELCNYTE